MVTVAFNPVSLAKDSYYPLTIKKNTKSKKRIDATRCARPFVFIVQKRKYILI